MKIRLIATAFLFSILSSYADDAQTTATNADQANQPTSDEQAQLIANEKAYQRSSQAADALRDLSRTQQIAGNTSASSMAAARSNVAQKKAIIAQDKIQAANDQGDNANSN